MNRHFAVHRPLLLASAALGAALILVTWPAGLAADAVAENAAKTAATAPSLPGAMTPAFESAAPRKLALMKRATKPAQDPVANATSHTIMGTLCAGLNSSTPMFTICDPDEFKATCCDDGTLVETLCKDGPTHGTLCENSPWGFTPTHCPAVDDGDKPFDLATYCANGEKVYTVCPDQNLNTYCADGPSAETACPNGPGGTAPTICVTGPLHTQCASGLLHTICQGGVPSRQTVCANAPGGVQPTFCAGGVVRSTFCPGTVTPTICTNGPNQTTVCPNGQTYTICVGVEPPLATSCPPPFSADGANTLHR